MIIDSHQHFWDPARFDYPWMTNEVSIIRRPFGPRDLQPILSQSGVSHTIVVQATSMVEETLYLQDIAASTSFVSGVVGWVDLTDPRVRETAARLKEARGGDYLVGMRHQVHDEPDAEWLMRSDVQRGLQQLAAAGVAYDLLVRTRELPSALKTARNNPDVRFVIDHIAKPPIREGAIDVWAAAMEPFSELGNVYCKLSGMVTEADWSKPIPDQLVPYVQQVLQWFGEDRLMFGSDWPVCLLVATYGEVLDALDHALGDLPSASKSKIYGANAARFYDLKLPTEA
jgi:L-fuconolactonase